MMRRLTADMRLRVVVGFFALCAPATLYAQRAPDDSTFRVGSCQPRATDATVWEHLVETPDERARLLYLPRAHPPLEWRDRNGNYAGKIVVAMVVDTAGDVIPGTLSIEESNDPRLSRWGCAFAVMLRFTPATVGGKPVKVLTEQPLSYYFGDAVPNFKKP